MISKGKGGANTKTGLVFEGKTDLTTFLGQQKGYSVENGNVNFNGKLVGRIFKKSSFYKFLEEHEIDWHAIISKRLFPDDSIYVIVKNTLFIRTL